MFAVFLRTLLQSIEFFFFSVNEGPFSNYLIDNKGTTKTLKNLPETLPSITRYGEL